MSEAIKKKTKKASDKKQRKFNFVDFLLILLILAIIGGAVYLFSPGSFINKVGKSTEGTLMYTIEIKGVDQEYIHKIKENDFVINAVTKSTLGTVSAADATNKDVVLDCIEVKNEDIQEGAEETKETKYEGALVQSADQYTILVTITATADYVKGDGYFVNNCRIAVGEGFSLHFPDFAAEGYCISIIPQDFN